MALHNLVYEQFGYNMQVFRYPEGAFNEQSLAVLRDMGYTTLFWSFAYLDYDVNQQPDKQEAYNRIVGAAHDGCIYLLHAVSQTNTEILGDVIDTLQSQGYEIAPCPTPQKTE